VADGQQYSPSSRLLDVLVMAADPGLERIAFVAPLRHPIVA
jgi:hypothetical protein